MFYRDRERITPKPRRWHRVQQHRHPSIQKAKDYISDLMQLTEQEQEYMDRFIAKEYVPELLFDDEEIVERIKEHPMAIWKCQQ